MQHKKCVHLIVNKRTAFLNLECLRRIILTLAGADSVILNRMGESFFLTGFKQSLGRGRSISVEIPLRWLENVAMMWQVENAAHQFGFLMNGGRSGVSFPESRPASRPTAELPEFRQVRLTS